MKKKIKYTNEPMDLEIVDDFLPSPDKLIPKEENIKVTIALTKSSVDFFKNFSKKHHTQYQIIIRNLLDSYASHYNKK